jgi:ribosomal protein S18 acetylase RimI-like enzyme
VDIRRLTAADATVYRALRLRAFRDHPEAFITSHEEFEAQAPAESEKRLGEAHAKFWGAFERGELCGYVGLEREKRIKARHKAKLIGMYVAPECTGRGVGRALVEALLKEARNDGLELVVLTVTEGNSTAAKLYERCGFRSFGVEPRAIKVGERAYGKNHMVLELTPSSPS